jgi:hypothetical protein
MRMDLQELQFAEIRKEIAQRMENSNAAYIERLERVQNHWDLCPESRLIRVLDMGLRGKYIFPDKLMDAKRTLWKMHRINPTESNMLAFAIHMRGD